MRLGKEDPKYPPLGSESYLLGWLSELGWYQSDGSPLGFTEIQAWSSLSGVPLRRQPIPEAAWLREISGAYAAEIQRANGTEVPPPYDP